VLFLAFHSLLIWEYLPGAIPRLGGGFDTATYTMIGLGMAWILATVYARMGILTALGRSQAPVWLVSSAGSLDHAIVLFMSGLLWCLAFVKATYRYWVQWSPLLNLIMAAVPVAELLCVSLSLVWTVWIWHMVLVSARPWARLRLILGAVATLFLAQAGVAMIPSLFNMVFRGAE
jgi:hypothetical protein